MTREEMVDALLPDLTSYEFRRFEWQFSQLMRIGDVAECLTSLREGTPLPTGTHLNRACDAACILAKERNAVVQRDQLPRHAVRRSRGDEGLQASRALRLTGR